jgi:hypothetical protein
MSDDFYAPHITDPDDPNEGGLKVTPGQFARNAAKRHPELIDHSLDGPIQKAWVGNDEDTSRS